MLTSVIFWTLILTFINQILFAIEAILCRICDLVYYMFKIYAGIEFMTYDGDSSTIFLNIFLENPIVTTVYNGMCAISIALAFAFAVISVIRKLFDSSGEKVKMTYGAIIINLFKSILLMVLMTLIVSATVEASSVLMQRIEYLFDYAGEIMDPDTIVFTESDYGYMYEALSIIGNYTLNPEEDNRYNINSCFNEIRVPMQQLEASGVFRYTYRGEEDSWQYALLQIYNAADIDEVRDLDDYDESLTYAIQVCGRKIKYGGSSFEPISSYTRPDSKSGGEFEIGKVIMMCGTMRCARNSKYNGAGASVYDGVRGQFLYGYEDAYQWTPMDRYFDINIFDYDHLVIIITGYFVFKQLVAIMFNAIARAFNIILLYLCAPPILAVMPLDDGAKFKEWTTAFVIQTCTLFGSFIAVRLMMIFIPIVMSDKFVMFSSSSFVNYLSKLLTMAGVVLTTSKASGMITGILAGNAGMQSIAAGNIGEGIGEAAGSALKGTAKAGLQLGGKVGKGLIGAGLAATGLQTKADLAAKALGKKAMGTKAGKALANLGNWTQAMRDKGGFKNAWKGGMTTNKQDKEAKEGLKNEAAERNNGSLGGAIKGALGLNDQGGGDQKNETLGDKIKGALGLNDQGGDKGGGDKGGGDKDAKQPPSILNMLKPDSK